MIFKEERSSGASCGKL